MPRFHISPRRTALFSVAIAIAVWLLVLWPGNMRAQAAVPSKTAPAGRPELALQLGHSLSVFALAYSPDGKLLASGGGDGTVKIWDAREHELIRTIAAHTGGVSAVAWLQGGSTLASAGDNGTVKFWNVENGKLLRTVAARPSVKDKSKPAKAIALAYSPDEKLLAVGYGDATAFDAQGELVLLDASTGKVRRVLARGGAVLAVAFAQDGSTLASGGADKTIRLWNVQTGAAIRVLSGHEDSITTLAFSPDGSTLASGSNDKTVRVWDTRSGNALQTLMAHSKPVRAVAFSSDGKILASSGIDRRIFLWDARSGRQLQSISELKHVSRALAFAPKENSLAAGSWSAVELWNANTGALEASYEERPRWTQALAYSPDGKTLATTGGSDKLVYVWSATTGRLMRTLTGSKGILRCVTFSRDGKWIAAGSKESSAGPCEILLWRAADGALMRRWPGHKDAIDSLAFSPDGKTLASGSSDGNGKKRRDEIKIWNPQNGALLRSFSGAPGWVKSLAFSPDGKLLASANSGQRDQGVVEVWNPQTGKLLRTLAGYRGWVASVAFAGDGSTLAGAGRDGIVRIWNARTGKFLKAMTHGAGVRSLSFSRDRSTLASGGADNLVRLWDIKSGKQLHLLRGHESSVETVAFSPNGKTLASGSVDTSVRIWNPREGRELAELLTAPSQDAESPPTLWLTATPEGYYDCAEGADYLIKWRFQKKLLPFYHFEESYRRPALLRRALAGERIAARPLLLTRVPPSIRIISPLQNATLTGKSVRILTEAADDAQISNFKLYVNGVLVPDSVAKPIVVDGKPIIVDGKPIIVDGKPIIVDGKPIIVDGKPIIVDGKPIIVDGKPIVVDGKPIVVDGKPIVVDGKPLAASGGDLENVEAQYAVHKFFVMDIPLPATNEDVTLRAVVTDNEQNKSDAAVVVKSVTTTPVRGDLYLLGVGVSNYRNPIYNIPFAAEDARAMQGVLQAQTGKAYAKVHATILTDKQATAQSIRAALEKLKTAKPDDTVMVFLSGHGLQTGGKYYFAPWGIFVNDIPGTCLQWNAILDALGQVYAKKLLFTDACFSGAKLGARQATGGELAELARRRSGLVMLSSSQADELSFEDKEVKQGAFTVALMEAFQGKADVDGDKKITLPELALYVPKRVSGLTKGLQNPQLVLVQDFNPQTMLAKVE
jgi:WD40 repeat protein